MMPWIYSAIMKLKLRKGRIRKPLSMLSFWTLFCVGSVEEIWHPAAVGNMIIITGKTMQADSVLLQKIMKSLIPPGERFPSKKRESYTKNIKLSSSFTVLKYLLYEYICVTLFRFLISSKRRVLYFSKPSVQFWRILFLFLLCILIRLFLTFLFLMCYTF